MKKTRFKPKNNQHNDFLIFAVTTTMADYKLAFQLNHTLGLNLAKQKDLPVYLSEKDPVFMPFFHFENDDQTGFYLVEDRIAGGPMMKNFLLLLKGFVTQEYIENLPDLIGTIDEVFSYNPVGMNEKDKKGKPSKKSRLIKNILTDLEYHMLEINRMKENQKVKLKPSRSQNIRKLYN